MAEDPRPFDPATDPDPYRDALWRGYHEHMRRLRP